MAIVLLATGGCFSIARQGLTPGSDVTGYPKGDRSIWEAITDPCTWSADTTAARKKGLACGATRDSVRARGGSPPPPQKVP